MPYKDPAKRKAYHAEYSRRHYLANRESYRDRTRTNNPKYVAAIRDYIRAAKDAPCTDCGVQYPWYVMDFDHLSDKEFNIGHAVKRKLSLTRVAAEIAKCELVCSNCHRIRTHQRSCSPTVEAEALKAF